MKGLRIAYILVMFGLVMAVVTSCSTKKNTGATRFWHSFTAKYNTYYNGSQAYINASLEKEQGNKDDFTERLPLYTVGNKASRELGKANYDIAITKSQKAIQLHSIKSRPEWNKQRRKTAKDIEWLSRKEYNPFLWKAWMLMGRSQFYQGNFDEAAATFSYMSRLYSTQPAIYGKARAWLAKCYIESGWLYDAEDVIHSMQRDSIDWRAQKEWDYTLCDYYLHNGDLPNAALYLRKVIKHEMRSKQRAREYYILGQIEAAQGNKAAAYKAFKKVISQNPPYELEFNARISMTEVTAAGQSRKMIRRLKRMARNENNKDYLDQVYYAIGNIYLADRDTANAIGAYEMGNAKATRTGIEKGVLLLHLGDLYWQQNKYSDARRCYGEAIGMLDKERKDYDQLAERSKVLDELVPWTDAVHLQDSLQTLAKMDEKERNAAIDRVIEALKEQEKKQQEAEAETEAQQRQQKYGNALSNKANDIAPKRPATNNTGANAAWYFYNPQLVQQGKQAFQRQWGRRENTDNWQRMNKTVVGDMGFAADEAMIDTTMLTDEQRDSLRIAEEKKAAEEERLDSAVNNPHKREYYMAQIPFTTEAIAESNEIIKEGLLRSAIIFKDKLDNLDLSERSFNRLINDYPDFEPKDEVYYHLFLLYSRKGQHGVASLYVDRLKRECPDSKLTAVLTDPYFADNAKYGKQLEDSLYGATYEAFKASRFKEVYANAALSAERFPLGDNRDRFIFIEGLTSLNDGNSAKCMSAMETVVKDYPQSPVAEMAGMIVNGVRSGRMLRGAKFDINDVWNRRNLIVEGADTTDNRKFSTERNTDYLFIMAYPPDSIDENKLLFQMARYNFTSFMVRDFDISIDEVYGMHHMTIGGFQSFDEARTYSRLLLSEENIKKAAAGSRPIVISRENLELLGSRYSYNDYDTFYVAHFAPLPVTNVEHLYEPVHSAETETTIQESQTPSFPTEAVAPGGAMPVTPNTSEEIEGETTEEADINIPVSEETGQPTQAEGIDLIMPEAEQTAPTQTEDVDIALPEEETNAAAPAADVFISVPTPEEAEAPADVEITISNDAAPATTDEILIDTVDEEQPSTSEDSEVIEISDDIKPTTDSLEDEYYELDGF